MSLKLNGLAIKLLDNRNLYSIRENHQILYLFKYLT